MLIHLTKKLAEKLNISVKTTGEEFDPLYSWRANIITENRRSIVVFMNDASRYVIALCEIKGKDWKRLPELFVETLRKTWLAEQINPEIIERYIANIGEFQFVKNTGSQNTAWLNKTCEMTGWAYYHAYRDSNVSHFAVSKQASSYFVGGAGGASIYPNAKLLETLQVFDLPVKRFTAYEFIVRLDLAGRGAVRKIRVAANITFLDFHKVLQAAFGWHNCHLFSFSFFKDGKYAYGKTPEIELVITEEDFEANPDALLMQDIQLNDYFLTRNKCVYTYDYGDSWTHHIELTAVDENCELEVPALLLGSGDAPPEDVGGSGGFDDFLRIMADSSDPEYEYMKAWAKSQEWQPFDFKEFAWRIKRSL